MMGFREMLTGNEAYLAPEVKSLLNHEGAEPVGNTPAEFAAIMKAESAKWARVIKAAGIKSE